MLILKIMSNQDMPDSSPDKQFKLISDVRSVQFFTDEATSYEDHLHGYEQEGRRHFCTILMPDGIEEDWIAWDSRASYLKKGGIIANQWHQEHPGGNWPSRKTLLTGRIPKSTPKNGLIVSFARVTFGNKREEVHLLTGNCYVLNDRGKTIESFWARRNVRGEQVGEE